MAALAGRAIAAKRGLVSSRSSPKVTGARGSNASAHVLEDDLHHALDQRALDGGVGPAFDAHCRGAAAASQEHVHNRIDEIGIDGEEAVIVELFGTEHRENRRQRDRIQVVAEADGGDVVEAHLDIVGREIAQARRHQPHEAVEDDFKHRQAFVGDERGIYDGANAALVLDLVVIDVEAQEAVDFFLIENALAAGVVVRGHSGRIDVGFDLRRGRGIRHSRHPAIE